MQRRAILPPLLPLAMLAGCQTFDVKESTFIRSDAVTKASCGTRPAQTRCARSSKPNSAKGGAP